MRLLLPCLCTPCLAWLLSLLQQERAAPGHSLSLRERAPSLPHTGASQVWWGRLGSGSVARAPSSALLFHARPARRGDRGFDTRAATGRPPPPASVSWAALAYCCPAAGARRCAAARAPAWKSTLGVGPSFSTWLRWRLANVSSRPRPWKGAWPAVVAAGLVSGLQGQVIWAVGCPWAGAGLPVRQQLGGPGSVSRQLLSGQPAAGPVLCAPGAWCSALIRLFSAQAA